MNSEAKLALASQSVPDSTLGLPEFAPQGEPAAANGSRSAEWNTKVLTSVSLCCILRSMPYQLTREI